MNTMVGAAGRETLVTTRSVRHCEPFAPATRPATGTSTSRAPRSRAAAGTETSKRMAMRMEVLSEFMGGVLFGAFCSRPVLTRRLTADRHRPCRGECVEQRRKRDQRGEAEVHGNDGCD